MKSHFNKSKDFKIVFDEPDEHKVIGTLEFFYLYRIRTVKITGTLNYDEDKIPIKMTVIPALGFSVTEFGDTKITDKLEIFTWSYNRAVSLGNKNVNPFHVSINTQYFSFELSGIYDNNNKRLKTAGFVESFCSRQNPEIYIDIESFEAEYSLRPSKCIECGKKSKITV